MFLQGLPAVTVTYYVITMTVSCLAIIHVSFGTTILPIHDTTLHVVPFLLIRASLGSVETGSSLLQTRELSVLTANVAVEYNINMRRTEQNELRS